MSPAASAKGTVSPSDIPITMSRTAAVAVKCFSTCSTDSISPPKSPAEICRAYSAVSVQARIIMGQEQKFRR